MRIQAPPTYARISERNARLEPLPATKSAATQNPADTSLPAKDKSIVEAHPQTTLPALGNHIDIRV